MPELKTVWRTGAGLAEGLERINFIWQRMRLDITGFILFAQVDDVNDSRYAEAILQIKTISTENNSSSRP